MVVVSMFVSVLEVDAEEAVLKVSSRLEQSLKQCCITITCLFLTKLGRANIILPPEWNSCSTAGLDLGGECDGGRAGSGETSDLDLKSFFLLSIPASYCLLKLCCYKHVACPCVCCPRTGQSLHKVSKPSEVTRSSLFGTTLSWKGALITSLRFLGWVLWFACTLHLILWTNEIFFFFVRDTRVFRNFLLTVWVAWHVFNLCYNLCLCRIVWKSVRNKQSFFAPNRVCSNPQTLLENTVWLFATFLEQIQPLLRPEIGPYAVLDHWMKLIFA